MQRAYLIPCLAEGLIKYMKIGGLHGMLLQANVYESYEIFIQHVNNWSICMYIKSGDDGNPSRGIMYNTNCTD